jgi:hypothetical protein
MTIHQGHRIVDGPPKNRMVTKSERKKLSAEARAARRPLAPEELVDARHDRIHSDPGRARAARTVRSVRSLEGEGKE